MLVSIKLHCIRIFFNTLLKGLKGVSLSNFRSTIDTMIKDLGLEEKRHTPSAALSGGQKRKLQLAISFIGNSKVIFLGKSSALSILFKFCSHLCI